MKTVLEWSNSFDTSIAAYSHTASFGSQASNADVVFDEYEKSIFLTKALEDTVVDLYSGRYTGDSFEATELLRRELDILVTLKDYTDIDIKPSSTVDKIIDKYNHSVFELPNNILYIIYELVKWSTNSLCIYTADVYPTTHDEYWRTINNPFRGPNKRRVLRLDKGSKLVELVSSNKMSIDTYTIRYLRRPKPIILTSLTNDTKIEGFDSTQTCELHESLHRIILDRAIRMALASKYINNNTKDNGGD